MAKRHVMTPARRAALRKAQLASARKRRRYGTVGGSVRRATRQRSAYLASSAQVTLRKRNPKKRKSLAQIQRRNKRVATAIVIGSVIGSHAAGAYLDHKDIFIQGEKAKMRAAKNTNKWHKQNRNYMEKQRRKAGYRGTPSHGYLNRHHVRSTRGVSRPLSTPRAIAGRRI